MLLTLALATALQAPLSATTAPPDPRRQFDFWVGEWSVQNRHLQADGSWADGTRTRARITPVCGGAAILEEWAGPLHGSFMNGFSLRAWNAEDARWDLVLFWTVDGNAAFGRLHGTFRHGRGEFFVPTRGSSLTRYTFSDALPETVRWDSARSEDGGQTWRTDWIMEFERTAAAADTHPAGLFEKPWNSGALSPHAEARALDWMLGSWEGEQVDAQGREREARLECVLLNKDCMILDVLRTRAVGDEDWDERLHVRAFEAPRGRWGAWSLAQGEPRLRFAEGLAEDGVMVFRGSGERELTVSEVLMPVEDGGLLIERAALDEAGESSILTTTTLRRLPD